MQLRKHGALKAGMLAGRASYWQRKLSLHIKLKGGGLCPASSTRNVAFRCWLNLNDVDQEESNAGSTIPDKVVVT